MNHDNVQLFWILIVENCPKVGGIVVNSCVGLDKVDVHLTQRKSPAWSGTSSRDTLKSVAASNTGITRAIDTRK